MVFSAFLLVLYIIKCLEAPVVLNWCYINKIELGQHTGGVVSTVGKEFDSTFWLLYEVCMFCLCGYSRGTQASHFMGLGQLIIVQPASCPVCSCDRLQALWDPDKWKRTDT